MDYIKWLSDNPIKSNDEDILQFKEAANVLTEMILLSDTPLTVGINGEWGSGKTSLMRLIEANIKEKNSPKILTSWFDTWKYTNEEEIWKLLMISLIEDLHLPEEYSYDIEKLISSAINIGLMTFNAFSTRGVSLIADLPDLVTNTFSFSNSKKKREEIILKDKSGSIKTFRSQFETLIEKAVGKNGKYIIFIDDLDRVHPHKTIDVIESIKNFLSCDRCIFVIGCDYNYLDACIKTKYENLSFDSKDYIEKIVPITYEMSNSNVQQLNIFLKKQLEPLFTTREDFDMASNLMYKSVGTNPRKLKRLINLYIIVDNLNSRGLDNCILLKLICLVERWPEIHKKLLRDFLNGKYTYKDYENWATPIENKDEYCGSFYYSPEEKDETLEYPKDPDEEYEEYSKNKTETIKRVESDLVSEKLGDKYSNLKSFLSSPPLFPHSKSDFEKYLSLVKAIDINTIKILENSELSNLPSVYDTIEILEKTIDRFDGQKVDGKYFSTIGSVTLPMKEDTKEEKNILKLPFPSNGQFGNWKYNLIDSKRDEKYFLDLIANFNESKSSILWLIYPWGFPKSVRDKVTTLNNIYLSNYYLLDDLNKHISE